MWYKMKKMCLKETRGGVTAVVAPDNVYLARLKEILCDKTGRDDTVYLYSSWYDGVISLDGVCEDAWKDAFGKQNEYVVNNVPISCFRILRCIKYKRQYELIAESRTGERFMFVVNLTEDGSLVVGGYDEIYVKELPYDLWRKQFEKAVAEGRIKFETPLTPEQRSSRYKYGVGAVRH